MKNIRLLGSIRRILILIPCIVMALWIKPSESADFSTYCQYPPYVFQSKLPSVMLLVSNSYSMSGFAYQNKPAGRTEVDASDGFVPGHRYYGYFDPDYWKLQLAKNRYQDVIHKAECNILARKLPELADDAANRRRE